MQAYLLIRAYAVRDVYSELEKSKGVIECHTLTGAFDLIARIEADDIGGLSAIKQAIAKLPHIKRIDVLTVTDIAK